jgi:hypothetical protein
LNIRPVSGQAEGSLKDLNVGENNPERLMTALRPIADISPAGHTSIMSNQKQAENFTIVIDASVSTKEELFRRITGVAHLGYSSFSGWDAFYDMFHGRLCDSGDILIEISNANLSRLSGHDRFNYLSTLADLQREFPEKLKFNLPDAAP